MKDLMPVITSNDGRFYNGNPATGEQGTRVTAEFLNDVQDHLRNIQEELKSILAAVEMTPNAQVQNQVYQAIKKIFSANLYDGVDSIATDLGVTARVANELSKSIETIDNGKVSKAGDTMIGNLTTPNVVLTANANKSLNNVIEAVSALFVGDRSRFQSLVNAWGTSGVTPLGVSYDFSNPNGWWIKFGPLYGNLIIQGGLIWCENRNTVAKFAIQFSERCISSVATDVGGVSVPLGISAISQSEYRITSDPRLPDKPLCNVLFLGV